MLQSQRSVGRASSARPDAGASNDNATRAQHRCDEDCRASTRDGGSGSAPARLTLQWLAHQTGLWSRLLGEVNRADYDTLPALGGQYLLGVALANTALASALAANASDALFAHGARGDRGRGAS